MEYCSSSLLPSCLHSQSPGEGLVVLLDFGLFLVSVVGRLCMLASALREERGGVDGASIPSCLTLGFSFGFTGCCKWMC